VRVRPLRIGGSGKGGEALPGLHQAGVEPQSSLIFAAGFGIAFGFGEQVSLIAVERGAARFQNKGLLALGEGGGKLSSVVQQARKGAVRGGVGGVKLDRALVLPLGIGGAL